MKHWTPSEDAALHAIYALWGADWKRNVFSADELDNRSISQCASRLERVNFYALEKGARIEIPAPVASKVQRIPWPEPGVIIFHDDPFAAADHGSRGYVSPVIGELSVRSSLYSNAGARARNAALPREVKGQRGRYYAKRAAQ